MKIEIFASSSCPHVDETLQLLEESLSQLGGGSFEITIVPVNDFEDAKLKRCFGSPTVRVEGIDVEYGDREPEEYTAGCRYYNTAEGWKPVPSSGMVLRAMREAAGRT